MDIDFTETRTILSEGIEITGGLSEAVLYSGLRVDLCH